MNHFETEWKALDGVRLYAQGWEPDGQAKAVVCLIHGLGEHSGRYAYVADFLNREGFSLFAFDLRGHGKSGGPRGGSPSFNAFMEDITLLLEQARRRYPGQPLFLYGHSLGALLALNFALRCKPDLAGVVVTGPGLHTPLTEQKLKIAFAKAMGGILPNQGLSTGLDPNALSRDPEVARAYISDPLVHDRTTLRMAKTTLEAIPWAFEHACDFNLPLLLMQGTADRLTYASGTQEFASRVLQGKCQCDCTVKLWEGLYHELHNEPEKEEVLQYMVDWMKDKM